MPRVAFLLSNDRHHPLMLQPVIQAVAALPGYACGVISLAELRGLSLPDDLFSRNGTDIPVDRIVAQGLRRALPLSTDDRAASGRTRRWMQAVSWSTVVGPRLGAKLAGYDLVVTPNDAAFPYDRICALLRRRGIPFLLVQEGIRFALPAASGTVYGGGGATAIAAWGETSAAYFRAAGNPPQRIYLTGNPRLDAIRATDWTPASRAIAAEYGVGGTVLLLLSNPIEHQGFCTSREKIALIERFLAGLAPLFSDPEFRLIIKLHPGEQQKSFAVITEKMPYAQRIITLGRGPLYPLFGLSRAAVILASTAGLEAMLFGVPVGVLEIPKVGFVHDYVRSGAALGVSVHEPVEAQIRQLFAYPAERRDAVRRYLADNLATVGGSTDRLVALIQKMVTTVWVP